MPAVAAGVFIGAFIAAASGKEPEGVLKGAIIGGVAGGIGSAVAGPAAGAAGGATEGALAEGTLEAGLAEGTLEGSLADAGTGLAATEAGTVAETGLLDAATGEALGSAATETLGSAVPEALGTPPIELSAPAADTPIQAAAEQTAGVEGAATAPEAPTTTAPAPTGPQSPGLIQQAMEWAKANPKLAAGVLQGGGSMVAGIGQGVGAYMTAERKAQLELENKQKLTEYYRQFIQSGSSGGAGVKLGISPASHAGLKNSSGGLIQRLT